MVSLTPKAMIKNYCLCQRALPELVFCSRQLPLLPRQKQSTTNVNLAHLPAGTVWTLSARILHGKLARLKRVAGLARITLARFAQSLLELIRSWGRATGFAGLTRTPPLVLTQFAIRFPNPIAKTGRLIFPSTLKLKANADLLRSPVLV